MHEMSLADSALRIVEETARREGARRVRVVVIEIGRLAAVEPQALAFCLDAASRGTLAEGARFTLVDVPALGRCADCAGEVALATLYDTCPTCGGSRIEPTQGTQMRVRDIEID